MDVVGKLFEGFVEGAVFGARGRLLVNLRGDALLDDLRPEHLLLHALAHERDGLIHVDGESLHARNPVVVVLDGLEAQKLRQLVNGLYAAALVDGQEVELELVTLDVVI